MYRAITHTSESFKSLAMRALHNCLLLSPMTQKYFSQEHHDSIKTSLSASSSTASSSSAATSIPLVLLSLLSLRIGPPEHRLAEQVHKSQTPSTNSAHDVASSKCSAYT